MHGTSGNTGKAAEKYCMVRLAMLVKLICVKINNLDLAVV